MEVEHHVKACTKKTVLRIVSANRKLLEKPPSLSKGDRPDLGAAEAAKTKNADPTVSKPVFMEVNWQEYHRVGVSAS